MASCRPVGTLVALLVVIALGWAFLLCGFLPGAVGDAWRQFLLSNPRNPSIGFAFLPAMAAIPIVLVLRHGGTKRAIAVIVAGSYLLAVAMEWMMRRAVHSWAPLDQPPFNMPCSVGLSRRPRRWFTQDERRKHVIQVLIGNAHFIASNLVPMRCLLGAIDEMELRVTSAVDEMVHRVLMRLRCQRGRADLHPRRLTADRTYRKREPEDAEGCSHRRDNVMPINGRSRARAPFKPQIPYPRLRSAALPGYAAPPDRRDFFCSAGLSAVMR